MTAAAAQLRPQLTGARMSALARCPRQAFYTATESEPEYDDLTKRFFARGQVFEDFIVRSLEAKHGKGSVQRQRPIPWGLSWTGHADAYIVPEKTLVEIVSTVAPSGLIFDFKLEQLRLYLAHDPEAEKGVLVVVNPSSLKGEDIIPVTLTDKDRERINSLVAYVIKAVTSGKAPDRVCEKPSDARAHLCPFAEPCFQGWEPPPAQPLSADAEQTALRMLALKVRRDNLRQALKQADAEWRNEGDALLLAGVEPGHDYETGSVKVRATEVRGRETFSMAKARKSGAWLPVDDERFAPFVSVGDPHTRWTLSGDHVPETDDDFGEVPPF